MRNRNTVYRTATLLVGGLLTAPLYAQNVLEEITVTAQKREQSLQEVPIAISAFSSETVSQMSIQNVGEVLNFVPNVVRSSGPSTGDDGFFFFRGVGQVDNSVNVDPGVGVYIDEVYLGRTQGASLDVLDIERIEVLRGPQGTFFGRNTIGGAVHAITRDPAAESGIRTRFIAGSRDRLDADVSLDWRASDSVGALLSLFSRNQEGWAEDTVTGATYGDREDLGGRFKLVWDATDRLTLKLGGDYSSSDGSPLPSVLVDAEPMGTTPMFVPHPADFTSYVDSDPFDRHVTQSVPPVLDAERGGVSLTANWQGEPVAIKSITAYRFTKQAVYTDLDGSHYRLYDFLYDVDQNQLSQELQLSGSAFNDRLQWLLGAYYFEEDVNNRTLLSQGTNYVDFTAPLCGMAGLCYRDPQPLDYQQLLSDNRLYLDVESTALFGQLDYDLTDRLQAVVGFRYTEESKDQKFDNRIDNRDGVFSFVHLGPAPPPGFVFVPQPGQYIYDVSYIAGSQSNIQGSPSRYSEDWEEFSPKLGLNYQLDDNLLLYASWSNGFKSGGFGGRATPGATLQPYDPETIETWELGIKSDWLDKRLRTNLTAFYSEYDDIQLLIIEFPGGVPAWNTRNVGQADIRGAELEVEAQPHADLLFNLGVGYLHNEYQELTAGAVANGVDLGDKLPNAPRWTANAAAQYRLGLPAGLGDLLLRADFNYRSEIYFQTVNNPGDRQGGFSLLNLRATWAYDDSLSVALFGTNVTDKDYYTNLTDQRDGLGVLIGTTAPGAEWGVEVNYRY